MPWLGSQRSMGPMLHALVYDSSWWPDATSGSGFQLVVAPSLVTPVYGLLYLKRAAVLSLSDFIHSWKWEYLDRVWSNTSALFG